MKKEPQEKKLSRREQQLLEALYKVGRASAADLREAIDNPPTYTAVRTHLSNLVDKGFAKVQEDGVRYMYEPVVPREQMASVAIDNVLETFFENRLELVVSHLLGRKDRKADQQQLDRLAAMIEKAREEGR